MVLRVRYGPFSMILPGDLEEGGEQALLRYGDDLRSTVLKVPHHGSRSSSGAAFLAAVAPRLAVVSSGYRNRFGMPHPEVIEAYRRRRIPLLRTDLDGAITLRVESDGSLRVSTGVGAVAWEMIVAPASEVGN
jgi:competence protein ComEC